jgi:hypothetical protein
MIYSVLFIKKKIFHIELVRLGQVNSSLPLSAQSFLAPGLAGLDHIFLSRDSESHATASVIGKIGSCLIFRLIWYVNPHHSFTLGLLSSCSVGVCRLSWLHILTVLVDIPLGMGDSFIMFPCKTCFNALSRLQQNYFWHEISSRAWPLFCPHTATRELVSSEQPLRVCHVLISCS